MATHLLKSCSNNNGSFDLLLAGLLQYRGNNFGRNNNDCEVHFIRNVHQLGIGLDALDGFGFEIDRIKDSLKPGTEDIAEYGKPYTARAIGRPHDGN